ncbi:MAG: trehalose-phosphatase [Pseudomonadota bacterium]
MKPPVPKHPAVFLDFDGTLVEIVPRPQDVVVEHDLPGLIQRLVDRTEGAVAMISGRRVADMDSFLHVPIAAAGMHGLERRAAPGAPVEDAPPPPEIDILRQRILAWEDLGDGVVMEDKGAGLAVHYRAAPTREVEVKKQMGLWVRDLDSLNLIAGKMVVEAKGKGFDKGVAVNDFMQHPPFAGRTPVFVGDDVTDEDGIRAAEAAGGFGVKVGDGPTLATYRLPDVSAVHDWLHHLADDE